MELQVGPGFISTFYFVLFNLFLVPVVDNIFSQIVSHLSYRRIFFGTPIELRSADVPGITACLLGSPFSFINLAALFLKSALLVIIFVMDFTIETSEVHSTHTRSGTFIFNASDSQREHHKNVFNCPFARMHYCRSLDLKSGQITYYSAAFNLENGTVFHNETISKSANSSYHVDESTFQCLGPNNVYEQYVVPNVRVLGCYSNKTSSCTQQNYARKNWQYTVDTGNYVVSPLVFDRDSFDDSLVKFLNRSEVRSIWNDFERQSLVCLNKRAPRVRRNPVRTGRCPNSSCPAQVKVKRKLPDYEIDCLLTARTARNETLLEHWRFEPNNSALERFYPGVLLQGDVDIGKSVRISILWHLSRKANWVELSTLLLSYSLVYEPRQYNFTRIGEVEYTVSVIPDYAIPLATTLVVVAIGAQILICFTIGKDKRPRFNTINGVSSILREEHEPTGKSLTRGNTAIIAWYFMDGRGARFGPCGGSNDAVISQKDREHFP